MDCVSRPYSRIPKSSKLLVDFLENYERVGRFYNGSPFQQATYSRLRGELRALKADREALVEILLRQNDAFGANSQTIENIRRLGEADTYAVVTGQQVGLFSGPAFTLYKALTAVRVSQSLTDRGIRTVPVFWLATEDHDLDEVSQIYVMNNDYEQVRLHDSGERLAPQSPVGRVKLTEAIIQQIDLLESTFPSGSHRAQLLEDLRSSYQPGMTWSQSFALFLTRLFGRWGVILLDPLDAAIRRLSVPIYRQALRQCGELRAQLLERSADLVKSGYHAQVHIAEQSTLLFGERQGNRLPVHASAGGGKHFSVGDDQTTSLEELESEIDSDPLNFSANVLLRPLVQDSLLPTIVYIAGPSELAYLGQASVLYSAFDRPMPAIFPRNGFTLVDRRIERWMVKYQLEIDDVWQGKEHLSKRIGSTAFAEGWSQRFDQAEHDLADLLARLRKDVEGLDPTLIDALNRAEERIQYQVEKLKGKMTRSAFSRSEVLARHEQALLRALMPDKELQERRIGGVYFLGHAGYELLDRLYEQIPAGISDHRIMNF